MNLKLKINKGKQKTPQMEVFFVRGDYLFSTLSLTIQTSVDYYYSNHSRSCNRNKYWVLTIYLHI